MDEKHWTRSKTISILKGNSTKMSILINDKSSFGRVTFFSLTFTP